MSRRNQRLNATISIGATLQNSVRRNLDFVGRGLRGVNDQIRSVTEQKRKLDQQRAVLERQGRSVAELDREYQDLNRTLGRLQERQRRLQNVQTSMGQVGSSYRAMTSEIGRFARRATFAIGAVGGATYGLASSTASAGDEVAKTAARLGMGVESLQEWRYAAERAGTGAGTFDSAVERMVRRAGQAAQGTGEAAGALDRLGIDAERFAERSPEEMLEILSERMEQVEGQAERSALAMSIMGRDGQAMNLMLGMSNEELEQLFHQGRRTGHVLRQETTKAAEDFADAQLDARLATQGLRNTIGAELMPVVGDAMRQFSTWVADNREPVREMAQSFADGLQRVLPILGDVMSGVGEWASKVGTLISKTAELVGGWENLGKLIAAAFSARLLFRIGAFAFAVGKLGVAVGGLAFSAWSLRAAAAGAGAAAGATAASAAGAGAGGAAAGRALAAGGAGGIAGQFVRRAGPAGALGAGLFLDTNPGDQTWSRDHPHAVGVGPEPRPDMQTRPDRSEQARLERDRALGMLTPNARSFLDGPPDADEWRADLGSIGKAARDLEEDVGSTFRTMSDTDGVGSAWSNMADHISSRINTMIASLRRLRHHALNALESLRETISPSIGKQIEDGSISGEGRAPSDILGQRDNGVGPPSVTDRLGIDRRAVGGAFSGLRPVLVGERGPELRFPSRSGFIATNRQLNHMTGLAERARNAIAQVASAPARGGNRGGDTVTNNITVNAAPGQSPREIADEVIRVMKRGRRNALFDPITAHPA